MECHQCGTGEGVVFLSKVLFCGMCYHQYALTLEKKKPVNGQWEIARKLKRIYRKAAS